MARSADADRARCREVFLGKRLKLILFAKRHPRAYAKACIARARVRRRRFLRMTEPSIPHADELTCLTTKEILALTR